VSGASASTATATIAIAEAPRKIALAAPGERPARNQRTQQYVGRFAPSPTGSLHLGSLLAALGSYADARSRAGRWLVRMEDLDRARVVAGSADSILRTLEGFALHWDGAVEYQSARTQHYTAALETLRSLGATFECSCSRRELESESPYPGNCRAGPRRDGPTAVRFRVREEILSVEDRLQGRQEFRLSESGDVIVRRRDGVFAYQLAVVVDDALQEVTDVVRGADLLASTPWQIALQQALQLPTPRYAHLPVVTEPSGEKLAKSRRSIVLDPAEAGRQLYGALRLLQQHPPAELELEPAAVIVRWACSHWRPERLQGVREVRAVAYGTSV